MTQRSRNLIVRGGDKLTLPCGNYQGTCEWFEWLFVRQREESAKRLIANGKTTTNRMDVAENCALVISNVTAEDGGRYTCRLLNPLKDYADVHLYVVTSEYLFKQFRKQATFLLIVFPSGAIVGVMETKNHS